MATVREIISERQAIDAAMERLKTKRKREENRDLISSLPDSILHNILGLLKTKEAVQTCVLSKRWEYLWTSLPSLHFDSVDFCYSKYVDFVNAVLLRRKPLPLDEFRLFDNFVPDGRFDLEFSDSSPDITMYLKQVGAWIQYATKHNTRVLHLPGYLLPSSYPYTSLDELYLHGYALIVAGDVNLPRVRKLTIYNGELVSDDLEEILSGCPILEYLSLDSCSGEFVIKHECLKHLAIVNYSVPRITTNQLFVSAPNLLSFYSELPYSHLDKITLDVPSLTSACLVMRHASTIECLKAMDMILPFLTNVQCLELYVQCIWHKELRSFLRTKFLMFQKLKDVTGTFSTSSCFQMGTWILKRSPNLKKLILLEQDTHLIFAKREASSILSRVSASSCKNLEINEAKQDCSYWMIGRSVHAFIDDTKDLVYPFVQP